MSLLYFMGDLTAWDSFGTLTHRQMTTDAIPSLSSSDYPDIAMYSANLINYSADETYSHGGNYLANGGNPLTLWRDKVLPQYKKGDYADAYDYIGSILHLVQDQGVPAHAFDIQHVSYWAWGGLRSGDDLEKYADDAGRYSHETILPKSGDDQIAFYADMISRTMDVVNTNAVSPPTGENWSDYWQAGNYGNRRFPYDRDVNWYVIQHDNFARNRITESINYVAGNMAAASKKLPPLVKDLKISSGCGSVPVINKQTGVQVSFKILENRMKTVKIFMTLDGEAIISPEYGTGKSYELSSGSDLPWESTYTISWDGKLASGQYPSDGEHTLYVTQCEVTSHFCEKDFT